MNSEQKQQRLQKVLANAGIASRRTIEEFIVSGRIYVNNQLAQLGQKVDPQIDTIELDGKLIDQQQLTTELDIKVLIYNKPVGVVCTRDDEEGRNNIFQYLPPITAGRWINVGRLDINSSGLILLTNNGELAHRLMHPSYKIQRQYMVRVLGQVTDEHKQKLLKGIELEDGYAAFSEITHIEKDGANQWLTVSLLEGRKREVRRLFDALELKVNRLMRIAYGDIKLPKELRSNRNQMLTSREINNLLHSVNLSKAKHPGNN
jgi:23S rRNA pseudouridine2605 synthase